MAALEVFAERGYDTATMQEVRRRAAVSNGSLFHFFPSKDALGASLYLEGIRHYQDGLIAELDANPPARASVCRIVRYHLNWTFRNRDWAAFLAERGHAAWSGTLSDQVEQANARLLGVFDGWLQHHIQKDAVKPVSREVALACLLGPAQFICRAWLTGILPSSPLDHSSDLEAAAWAALQRPRRAEGLGQR